MKRLKCPQLGGPQNESALVTALGTSPGIWYPIASGETKRYATWNASSLYQMTVSKDWNWIHWNWLCYRSSCEPRLIELRFPADISLVWPKVLGAIFPDLGELTNLLHSSFLNKAANVWHGLNAYLIDIDINIVKLYVPPNLRRRRRYWGSSPSHYEYVFGSHRKISVQYLETGSIAADIQRSGSFRMKQRTIPTNLTDWIGWYIWMMPWPTSSTLSEYSVAFIGI